MHNICSDFNETLKADSFISQSPRVLYVCRIGIFSHPMTLIQVTLSEGTIYERGCSFFLFLQKTGEWGGSKEPFYGKGFLEKVSGEHG